MPQFVGDVFGLNNVYDKQILNVEQKNFANWSESGTYGYYGGSLASLTNTITRLDFFNETVSDLGNNLPSSIGRLSATSSSSYGYFGGGYFTPPATFINTISRLDFSNETLSNPGNNLPSARRNLAATSNSN